jgi:hypothetical protein
MAAPIREIVQRIIELRFPHLRTYVVIKPGTGGCKSRNTTSTTINAIVTVRAIRHQYYHRETYMSTIEAVNNSRTLHAYLLH